MRSTSEKRRDSPSAFTSQEQPSASPTSAALLAFAEELGRLVARQLLADPNRRRGYGLPEGMVGLAFNAVMLLLAYYLVIWLRH